MNSNGEYPFAMVFFIMYIFSLDGFRIIFPFILTNLSFVSTKTENIEEIEGVKKSASRETFYIKILFGVSGCGLLIMTGQLHLGCRHMPTSIFEYR